MKRLAALTFLSLTLIFLGACAAAAPPPAASPTATRQAPEAITFQSTATNRPQPTMTPHEEGRATPSATAGPDFDRASILSVAHLEDQRLMVTIQIPGRVQGAYDGYIGSSYLPCETPYQYPDRIICVGPEPYLNYSPEGALFELYPLYPDPQAPPLFSARLTVPARATPTATEPVWYPPLPDLPGTITP